MLRGRAGTTCSTERKISDDLYVTCCGLPLPLRSSDRSIYASAAYSLLFCVYYFCHAEPDRKGTRRAGTLNPPPSSSLLKRSNRQSPRNEQLWRKLSHLQHTPLQDSPRPPLPSPSYVLGRPFHPPSNQPAALPKADLRATASSASYESQFPKNSATPSISTH